MSSKKSSGSGSAVAEAVERLKAFASEKEDMEVEFSKPLTAAQVKKLEAKYKLKLPPSYVAFLTSYGAFKVNYGGQELIGMESPEHLHAAAPDPSDASGGDDPEVEEAINEALFFQRINTDSVENFWCFNPRDRNADGELGVVAYYHDDTFGLPQLLGGKHAKHFRTFDAHIVKVIDKFIETYANE
ncbi:SMI1/KNR4 family protein [Pyxidicoccus parkwayensis]|uniref:SMI1/KNR4 family protein n=1 Tax=Pyxidicoccus parkwayensis TaxID=2813578 RepID=A0ABX7NP40_9BACT|nr:SMI1/KNR4 family protein [Pyxidicoccus parkwaysis]QSQ20448.1 SMI1/KNR4 family protein [Pyxidicoccus parkwaysis]